MSRKVNFNQLASVEIHHGTNAVSFLFGRVKSGILKPYGVVCTRVIHHMDIFLIYLFDRFIYRISHFIRHWYVDSFMRYSRFVIARLEDMDQTIALKVTWRNLFQPMYQERNITGYVLGFIFRSIRLVIGSVVYSIVIIVAAGIFLIWAGILPYILLKIAGQTPAAHLVNVKI